MYTIFIWDHVSLFGLKTFSIDFIDYVDSGKDVTKVDIVVSIGTNIQKFTGVNFTTFYFICVSYHLTSTYI